MSAPDDLERRRHRIQPRPTSHWGKPDDLAPHPGPVASCSICAETVECCASGRCEVCTPGFIWGRDA